MKKWNDAMRIDWIIQWLEENNERGERNVDIDEINGKKLDERKTEENKCENNKTLDVKSKVRLEEENMGI